MKPTYNRLFVKMVRDKTRKHLVVASQCYVTGSTTKLEIHHMYTLSALVQDYLKSNNIVLTDENKLVIRDAFITEYKDKLQEQVVLSKNIHAKLHSIFGAKYPTHIAPKVRVWLDKQREKHEQLDN